jgi:hypothetical protein
MIVRLNPSALRETRALDYVIRFALGGMTTVIAGLVPPGSDRSSAVCSWPFR